MIFMFNHTECMCQVFLFMMAAFHTETFNLYDCEFHATVMTICACTDEIFSVYLSALIAVVKSV